MSKNVEIDIFFISKTEVDKKEVRRWLDRLEVSSDWEFPPEEIVSDPALNIALASKRCYNSFEVGINPNVTKVRKDYAEYIDNILASGHGCYDSETDVLTDDGWKKWPDVIGNEKFATLNTETNELEYQNATNLFLGNYYQGKMYYVDGSSVNLCVTPNHRMYVCKTTTKEGRKGNKFEFILAQDLDNISHIYKKTCKFTSNKQYFTDSMMKLIGFAVGDGYARSKHCFEFHLRKSRKIEYLLKICQEIDVNCIIDYEKDTYRVYLDNFDCNSIYNEKEKIIPKYLMDSSNLEYLFEGLMNSDGCYQKTCISFTTTSKELSDQFCELCLKVGKSCNVSQAKCYKDRKNSYGNKPIFRHTILQQNLRSIINKFSGSKSTSKWIDYNGLVYCVSVPNGSLFIRRKGKMCWCGNSVAEHSVYSFAIEGISRVFSGEMNRHRAGWAISEGSMRYIRFDKEIPWWMPLSIRENPNDDEDLAERKEETRNIFKEAFGNQRWLYEQLLKIWDLDDQSKNFAYKKKMTSLFRRIIGMGVATGGIWSGNIRALRHVLTMRCSPAAEEEICYVFSRIAKEMKEREPLLFGDFEEDENGFWKPKYVKV